MKATAKMIVPGPEGARIVRAGEEMDAAAEEFAVAAGLVDPRAVSEAAAAPGPFEPKEFSIGMRVQWRLDDGSLGFDAPRRLVEIGEHNGELFGFVDDSDARLPLNQLIAVD